MTNPQQLPGSPVSLWRSDARAMIVALVALELLLLGFVLWRASLPSYVGPVAPQLFVTAFDLLLIFLVSRGSRIARYALIGLAGISVMQILALSATGTVRWDALFFVLLAAAQILLLVSPALRERTLPRTAPPGR